MNSSALLDEVLKIVNFQNIFANHRQLLRNNKKQVQETKVYNFC